MRCVLAIWTPQLQLRTRSFPRNLFQQPRSLSVTIQASQRGLAPQDSQVLRRSHLDLGGRHARAAQEAPDLVPPPCHARRAALAPHSPSHRRRLQVPALPAPDRARHPVRSRDLLVPGPGLAGGGRQAGGAGGGERGGEAGDQWRRRGAGARAVGRPGGRRARAGEGARAGRTLLPGARAQPSGPSSGVTRCTTPLSLPYFLRRAPSCSQCSRLAGDRCDSILFYSILFYSILFYSILFYSILFYSCVGATI